MIEAAKKEGSVVWYTTLIVDQLVRPLAADFEKRYGIKLEYYRANSADVAIKVINESRAGRVQADVIDGTGTAGGRMDVGVRDGLITAVGDLSREAAGNRLHAAGRVLAPGFIDMHSHSDWRLWANRRAESKIRQGVTTEVVGNCGFSPAPVAPEHLDEFGHTNNVVYLSWLQDVAWAHSVSLGFGMADYRRVGAGCVAGGRRGAERAAVSTSRQPKSSRYLRRSRRFMGGAPTPAPAPG